MGPARFGAARQEALGAAWSGVERIGLARQAAHGVARPGPERNGLAWQRRHGRQGVAWIGEARRGEARHYNLKGEQMSKIEGVKQVIQGLYETVGSVRPSELVEAARPEASPAHDAFLWDDEKAGEEYRLIQARQYIRIVRIEVDGVEDRLVHVPRIMEEDDDSNEGEYKPIHLVVQIEDEYERALGAIRRSVEAAKRALDELRDARMVSELKPKDLKREHRRHEQIQRGIEIVEQALT